MTGGGGKQWSLIGGESRSGRERRKTGKGKETRGSEGGKEEGRIGYNSAGTITLWAVQLHH